MERNNPFDTYDRDQDDIPDYEEFEDLDMTEECDYFEPYNDNMYYPYPDNYLTDEEAYDELGDVW